MTLVVKKTCGIGSYFADMMMMIVARKYALHETLYMGVIIQSQLPKLKPSSNRNRSFQHR